MVGWLELDTERKRIMFRRRVAAGNTLLEKDALECRAYFVFSHVDFGELKFYYAWQTAAYWSSFLSIFDSSQSDKLNSPLARTMINRLPHYEWYKSLLDYLAELSFCRINRRGKNRRILSGLGAGAKFSEMNYWLCTAIN